MPICKVIRLITLPISGRSSRNLRIRACSAGSMLCPINIALISIATKIAMTMSNAPITIVPSASHSGLPVNTVSAIATSATLNPSIAAMFSPTITISSAWRLSRNHFHRLRPPRCCAASCKAARVEIPSATRLNTSTPTAHHHCVTGSGCFSLCTPSYRENMPPTVNSITATRNDQK